MTSILELGIKVDSTDAVQASSDLDKLTEAGGRAEKSTSALGETSEQAQARILELAKAAVAAKEAQQNLSNVATGLSEAQQGLITSTAGSAQAQAQASAAQRETVVSTDRLAASSARATAATTAQQSELQQLLEQIDPTTRALNRLDEQERQLAQQKKLGLDPETFSAYQSKIDTTRSNLSRFDDSLSRTGNTAKQTAAALRGVPAQFTDIFVSLQGGQAPLTVLLQQGGQLKDMFGGIGPAARAMGGYILGLVNPYTLAAAAVGVLALAYYQGSKEQDAFRLSLVTTGNAAGTTTTALAAMAQRVSSTVGTTGEAAAALAQLAGTGKIASSSFEEIAAAAVSYEKATGRAVSETIAEFVKLADDPVKAVAELNNKYNFLTASVYEQVRAAQEMGEKDAAASIAQEALARALSERAATMKANLGTLERAWNDLAGAAKSGWDAILGIGRESSSGPDVKAIQQKINYLRSTLDTAYEDDDAKDRIKSLQAELDAFQKKSKAEQDAADATANAARVQRDGQAAYEGFQKSLEQNFTKRQKMNKALEDEEKRISAARAAGYTITAKQEQDALKAIRENTVYKEAAGKKPAAYREDAGVKALDQARQQFAVLEQQNALIGAQKGEVDKLGAAGQALVKWEQELADIKAKKVLTADQKALIASQDLITAQLKKNAGLEKEIALKKLSEEEGRKLSAFQTNQSSQLAKAQAGLDSSLAGASLGDQQRQRMQERFSIEQQYQQQMDNLLQQRNEGRISPGLYQKENDALQRSLDDRLEMQERYYSDVDQAQGNWANGARSAFSTYLESAKDVAGQTKSLFTNAFSSMEDAIVNFALTGKLSFADFAKSIIADMARIAARQAASSALSSLFGMAASAAGSYFGGAASAGSTQAGYTSGTDFSSYQAKGGGWDGGVQFFKDGGAFTNSIVSKPAAFGMAGGKTGIVGEAGPEAIMPLTRTAGGALGVRALGGGQSSSNNQVVIQQSFAVPEGQGGASDADSQAVAQAYAKSAKQGAQEQIAKDLRPGGQIWAAINGR